MVTGTQAGSFASVSRRKSKSRRTARTKILTSRRRQRDPRLVSRIPLRPRRLAGQTPRPSNRDRTCDETRGRDVSEPDGRTPSMVAAPGSSSTVRSHAWRRSSTATVCSTRPVKSQARGAQLVQWMKAWTPNVAAPQRLHLHGRAGPLATSRARPTRRRRRRPPALARPLPQHADRVRAHQLRARAGDEHDPLRGPRRLRPSRCSPDDRRGLGAGAHGARADRCARRGGTTRPAPFFFVVDQRRLGRGQGGGPTRGQLLRVIRSASEGHRRVLPTSKTTSAAAAFFRFSDSRRAQSLNP